MLFGMGWGGIEAIWTPVLQRGHPYLGRTWTSTRAVAGMNSTCSEVSRPISTSA